MKYLLLVAALVAGVADATYAETLVDRFRPDGGYAANLGQFVKRFDTQAAQFFVTASSSYALTSIDLPLKGIADSGTSPVSATITIRTDANNFPGDVLEEFNLTSIIRSPSTFALGTYHLESQLHPTLLSQTAYWVTVDYTDPIPGRLFWNNPLTGQGGRQLEFDHTTGSWRVQPATALRVSAGPVPEPESLLLAATGGILFVVGCRRIWPTVGLTRSAGTTKAA